MKILHFNDFEHCAGAETAVRRLRKESMDYGLATRLVTKQDVGVLDALKVSHAQAIAEAYRPDVIHVHNTSSIGKAPFVVARNLRIPVVWTLHDYRLLCSNTLLLQTNNTPCERLDCAGCSLYQKATDLSFEQIKDFDIAFVVASDYVKNRYSRILSARRIYWDAQPELLEKEAKPVRNPHFLFGGRMDVEKGVEYVLLAVKRLKRKHPGVKLVFAGDSRGYCLERLSKLYGIEENIDCLGLISKESYEQVMQECFAVVCASIWEEPFNLTLLEAMSMGKPVIATDVGGQSEVVGNAGIRVMPKSSIAIARAMESLLADNDYSCRMGRASREQAKRFHGCTKNYIDLYEELHRSRS